MLAVALHVAESVRSDARARVNRDAIADHRAAVDRDGRIQVAALTQDCTGGDDTVRSDDRLGPNARSVAQDRVWADSDVLPELYAGSDHGSRVDAWWRRGKAVKPRQQRE